MKNKLKFTFELYTNLTRYLFGSLKCLLLESSTDDSTPEERISTPDREYNLPRDHLLASREQLKLPSSSRDNFGKSIPERRPQNLPHQPTQSDTSSAGSPPAVARRGNNSYDLASDIPELAVTSQQRSRESYIIITNSIS